MFCLRQELNTSQYIPESCFCSFMPYGLYRACFHEIFIVNGCVTFSWSLSFLCQDNTVRVIWAYHPDDPTSEDAIAYHGNSRRGTKSLYLIQHTPMTPPAMPNDTTTLDFLNPNVRFTLAVELLLLERKEI